MASCSASCFEISVEALASTDLISRTTGTRESDRFMGFSPGVQVWRARSRLTHAPGKSTFDAKRNAQLSLLFFATRRDSWVIGTHPLCPQAPVSDGSSESQLDHCLIKRWRARPRARGTRSHYYQPHPG